jgi:molybdate transport repressor ModE-like protein
VLDVKRIQLLREVARRGTITAAAAAVHVTPSAVSQQLKILEEMTGAELLVRGGRGVRLTEAGQLLVRHADRIAKVMAEAEADLADMRGVVVGDFRLVAFPSAARAIVPSIMVALSLAYPALRLSLRVLEAEDSVAALHLGEVDIALIDQDEGLPRVDEAEYERHDVLRDAMFVAFPPDRSPQSGPVGLWELKDEYWVAEAEGGRSFTMMLRACHQAGFEPRIRAHTRDTGVIMALVEAGVGIALLPGLALHGRQVRASVCPTNPPITRNVVAAVNRERREHPAISVTFAELERFGRAYRLASNLAGRAHHQML